MVNTPEDERKTTFAAEGEAEIGVLVVFANTAPKQYERYV
jgi:hypothetical protein